MMTTVRTLTIYVYSNSILRQCANGGSSDRYDQLLLQCDDGPRVAESTDARIVSVRAKRYGFGWSAWLEPVAAAPQGTTGYMMGGSYAAASDARYRKTIAKAFRDAGADYDEAERMAWLCGALPIHDRLETQAQSELLSR